MEVSTEQTNITTFRDYLGIVFRQKNILFTTIVTVLTTVFLGLNLKTPVYEANVKMLISAEKLVQAPNYRDLGDFRSNVEESQTQSEIVTSTPVIKRVVQSLKLYLRPMDYERPFASPLKRKLITMMVNKEKKKFSKYSLRDQESMDFKYAIEDLKSRVKVAPIPDTDMFTISVKDFSPSDAAITANVLARSYVIFDLEQQLADLSIKYGDKQANVLELKDNISKMIRNLNGSPLSNIDAIGPATVKIIQQADIPLSPKGPGKTVTMILGLVMGVFLGVMIVFFVEYIDSSFRSPQQIESELDLPFLGSVPRRKIGEKLLIHAKNTNARYNHFYQVLSDQLYLLVKDNHLKTVLFTSADSKEGTSTIITNLGLFLSGIAHHKVLLIDANLRNPSLHKLFNLRNTDGFAELMEGKKDFKDIVQEVGKNLHIVTAGDTELNPVILLNSSKVTEVLEEAKKKFEVILIDCPNIVGFKDSIVLTEKTDATVLVVSEGITRRHIVKIALKPLLAKKVNLLGVILNNRTFPIPNFVYERV